LDISGEFFPATLLNGKLYVDGFGERGPWDTGLLALQDEATVGESEAGLPAIRVWINERLADAAQRIWERRSIEWPGWASVESVLIFLLIIALVYVLWLYFQLKGSMRGERQQIRENAIKQSEVVIRAKVVIFMSIVGYVIPGLLLAGVPTDRYDSKSVSTRAANRRSLLD
jgi:hypothetical protein